MVLAINTGDKRSKYESFIQSTDYAYLNWARDGGGTIGKAYRAYGVPTLYIVDQEGVIHAVHVGYESSMAQAFDQQVEALLR